MVDYTSLRLWSKFDSRTFDLELLKYLGKIGLRVANFDHYGLDGASYRIDIRCKSGDWKPSVLKRLLKSPRWGNQILKAEVAKWNEADAVKEGHDIGSTLAIRYRATKLPKDWITVTHFLALLIDKWWAEMSFPYWHREYNKKKFSQALAYVTKGLVPVEDFTVIERIIHNFLNNLGFGEGPEGMIWHNLMRWWWVNQLAKPGGTPA